MSFHWPPTAYKVCGSFYGTIQIIFVHAHVLFIDRLTLLQRMEIQIDNKVANNKNNNLQMIHRNLNGQLFFFFFFEKTFLHESNVCSYCSAFAFVFNNWERVGTINGVSVNRITDA